MSIFETFGGKSTYKPEPKSVGYMPSGGERYTDDFNGEITVVKVDEIQKGDKKGAIIVHMANARLKKANMEIRDGFFPPKKGTKLGTWRKTQVDRVTGAMKSAGLKVPEKVEMKDLKGFLEELVGKTVVISQWTPEGEQYPRVNYKFEDEDASDDDEEEVVDDDEEVA